MRIAFLIKARVRQVAAFLETTVTEDTHLTIIAAHMSSNDDEKDRLAFRDAGTKACTEAVEFLKGKHAGCKVFGATIAHFQVL